MSEPTNPSLVQLSYPKEEADKAFALIGRCISEWANVDRDLFDLCAFIIGDELTAAIVFYRHKTIGNKRDLVFELAEAKLPQPDQETLKPLWKVIEKNLGFRNVIAHHPSQIEYQFVWEINQAEGTITPSKSEAYFQVVREPKEALLGRDPITIKKDELEAHWGTIKKLHQDLSGAIRVMQHHKSVANIARFAGPVASQQTGTAQHPHPQEQPQSPPQDGDQK